VRQVDLSIDTGEVVALLGPNGASKSTTIDMLLGLAAPDAGTVSISRCAAASERQPRPGRCDAPDR
jgi:ABC-2 type transport system ATP-binding protein